MILTRIGNKRHIADKIINYFPPHKTYIDMFFGAGGMFFSKPKAKYNILNDLDSDVFNLFMVVKDRPEELKKLIYTTPIHEDLLDHWRVHRENDQVWAAMRFLFLSNYTLLSKKTNLVFGIHNAQALAYSYVDKVYDMLFGVEFMNRDFRDVLPIISFQSGKDKESAFVYADPPYLGTTNNYEQGFIEKDTEDLFEILVNSGFRFAISEFDNPFVLDLANRYNLNVFYICDRRSLNNRRVEILITNYKPNLLFY